MEQPPHYCPTPREQDDLELVLGGALPPRPDLLALPTELADTDVLLTDPEGTPLARRSANGSLLQLARREDRPFQRLYLTPPETRARYGDDLPVVVRAPLSEDDLTTIDRERGERPALLLALVGHGSPVGVSAVGLLRASLAAAGILGRAHVVAVPLADHGAEEEAAVLAQYTATPLLRAVHEGPLPLLVEEVVNQDRPPLAERGLVVFFTGLSGSGKSTLARELTDLLLEDGRRSVTSLDGDVVRRHLSAGLGFSRTDRETNILRIGWVAAEIARHHGVAICSPIAPFDDTRQRVRGYVADAGGSFFLVHVTTPLEECERRDKKGLYARARAGEIPDFTGISSPYEEPHDADVRVDTTGRSVADALADVLDALAAAEYLDLRSAEDE